MSLDETLKEHFERVSTADLIRRINRAEDFGYDDESYELNRRLREQGLDWKWVSAAGGQVVEVFNPSTGESANFQ